jgi:hypothetical protein
MKKNAMMLTGLIMLTLYVSQKSFAQLSFGIRAGVSSSSIKMNDVKDKTTDQILMQAGDATVGFHFGVMGRVQFLGFLVQPEILFSSTGGEVKVRDAINNTQLIKNQKFSKIDIPILLGKTLGPARIEIGPIASFIINSKSEVSDLQGAKDSFKKATWGYQAGIGVDVWKFAVDLKYEGNLSKLGKDVTFLGGSYPTDSRNPQWVLSLGFLF